nr:hypothetical protein A152_13445 [Vibrio tasmaniensis 1F-187]
MLIIHTCNFVVMRDVTANRDSIEYSHSNPIVKIEDYTEKLMIKLIFRTNSVRMALVLNAIHSISVVFAGVSI